MCHFVFIQQFDGTLHVGYDLAYTYGKTEGRKFQLAGMTRQKRMR